MGGIGSGRRWDYSAKNTTSGYNALDVRQLNRKGVLKPGITSTCQWSRNGETVAAIRICCEEGRIILLYRHQSRDFESEWHDKNYSICLEWTTCHLGGNRPWFICPALGCSRRVAILYGGEIFACRHCYQLAYESQRETLDDRVTRRADKIREKLKWEPGILNGEGRKPKGMHWNTFMRLTHQYNVFAEASLFHMMRQFDRYGKS